MKSWGGKRGWAVFSLPNSAIWWVSIPPLRKREWKSLAKSTISVDVVISTVKYKARVKELPSSRTIKSERLTKHQGPMVNLSRGKKKSVQENFLLHWASRVANCTSTVSYPKVLITKTLSIFDIINFIFLLLVNNVVSCIEKLLNNYSWDKWMSEGGKIAPKSTGK